MQSPIASLAFCRRYISEADAAWRYVTPPDRLFDGTRNENPHHAPICGTYPLIGRCEWVFNEEAETLQVDADQYERNNGEFIDSMTGELSYRRSIGQLQIRAPKLQGLVGAADGSSVDLGAVEMALEDTGELSVCTTVHRGLSQFSRHTGKYAQWVNGSGRENGTVPFVCSGENSLRHRPVNAYVSALPPSTTCPSTGPNA